MNPLPTPFYLFTPLVAASIILSLAIVVWQKSRRDFSSRLFCGFLLCLGASAGLTFGMRSSPDIHHALPWDKALVVALIPAFVLYYHFTLAYTNARAKRMVIPAIYSFMVVSAVLTATTDLGIQGMSLEYYGYAPVAGPISFVAYALMPLLIAGGVYNLLRCYRESASYEERNRLLYLAIAVVFPLSGTALDAFSNLPPACIWTNLAFCIICSVAILKYRLLDIQIVVRKSLAYILVSVTVAVPYVGMLLALNQILKTRVEPWWTHAIIILLLAILLRPLHSRGQALVDRLFYQDRYDYLRALEQFTKQTKSIVNLEELCSNLVQLVSGALRVSSACLLLSSEARGGLVVACSDGLQSSPSGVVLRHNSPLVKWLRLHQRILSSEDLNIVPQLQSFSPREKNVLERMGAKLYVPIRSREVELSGLLILGQKLSQQNYSNEDKQLLTTLGDQMAMALENARLYSDALRLRQNLETWLNSMSDCVVIVNTGHRIEFMNQPAIERFGNRTGRVCWDILGKDTECSTCPIQHHRGNVKETSQYIGSIGDRQYDVVAATLVNPDGSSSIIEVLRDITERKQAEERQHQLQEELQRASRLAAIGELAAGVAHELNNPLTGIAGYSQLLLKEDVDERVRKGLERINSEAWRAAKVVENLRTFARRREPKKEYSNINEILQKALELRIYELKANNVHVVTELDSTLPEGMVDFHQIQEVFLNIIINAEQAMTEANRGGQITIKTQKQRGYIRIIFRDNGPGIPAEHINKVFDPFFTTRGERDGTGLGLSICHSIVTEHGGKISVKSKPGEGATFFVELPVQIEKGD